MKQKLKKCFTFYRFLNFKMLIPDDNDFINVCPLMNLLNSNTSFENGNDGLRAGGRKFPIPRRPHALCVFPRVNFLKRPLIKNKH